MKKSAFVIGLCGLSVVSMAGVHSGEPLAFEVATIKPSAHRHTVEGSSYSDQKVVSPGRFRAINSNLDELIRWAYDIQEYQLEEPEWLKSSAITFDIEATAGSNAAMGDIRLMLRQLLSDRFRVAMHPETRMMAVYNLVVDKDGLKLQQSGEISPRSISFGHGNIKTSGTTMERFASGLSRELHRPVIDKTGVVGVFVIDIRYATGDSLDNSGAPTLFTAIREVGLRLASTRAPIDILKIDHAEKTPTPN